MKPSANGILDLKMSKNQQQNAMIKSFITLETKELMQKFN